MEAEVSRPYILSYTDHHFYIRYQCGKKTAENLRINRLTNKMEIIDEQTYQQENSTNQYSHSKKMYEPICLVIGTLLINQQPYLLIVHESEPVIYQVKNIRCIPFKHKLLYHSVDQEQNEKTLNYIKDEILINNFYFCHREEITMTRQRIYEAQEKEKLMRDNRFFWNQKLLEKYPNSSIWRVPIMQGHVQEIYCENTYFSFYYLSISRRSKHMSGTRFNCRGLDNNGNASNFVETEEIFVCHQWLFSHVGIRGSAPIYWAQSGVGQQITFPKESESQMALQRHYEQTTINYNSEITTVNLLSKGKYPQKDLKNMFQFYFCKVFGNKGKLIYFDLNQETKDKQNGQIYIDRFVNDNFTNLIGQHNFFCLDRYTNTLVSKQYSVPRVNCLDCIDRTNVVLARIGEGFLRQVEKFINNQVNIIEKKLSLTREFLQGVIEAWSKLGDSISMMYCGTESVATHLTKRQNNSLMSFLTGGIKSINRYYNATVNDGFKQECLGTLLGAYPQDFQDPLTLCPYFEDNICERQIEEINFCSYSEVGVYVLTWNCSMADPQKLMQDAKKSKLFWFHEDDVDIVIVCLQEMVELNSYNVLMGNNETIVSQWQNFIERAINEKRTKKIYRYLTSYDLVGISTFIFVEEKVYNKITEPVVCQEIKTGFKGSLGNKGAIMFFFTIDSTRITIINCHLSAGEGKQSERVQDIQYVHQDAIKDRKKRRFLQHSQFRFLIGDLNFRLDAKNEDVRKVLYGIEKQEEHSQAKLTRSEISVLLQTLLQKDQLKHCQTQHGPLSTYSQPEITFLPTYKYVKRSHQYDSKRTPSWCDRILYYSREKLKISALKYQDVDCHQSDHKPVMGIFRLLTKKEDPNKKRNLIQQYLRK